MQRSCTIASLIAGLMVFTTGTAIAEDDAALIKSAELGGPAAISSEAAIYARGSDGKMRTLREGKNGWWCMPDDPSNQKPDPMCGDANAMDWAMAWIGHTVPPKGKVGFTYMLQGGGLGQYGSLCISSI
jgi:hypothetical protein